MEVNKASFYPEVLYLHVQMIFWINRWFTCQIKAKSGKMRQIHFNKCRFWATGRKHQEVRKDGGGGQSNSAPSQITQRRLLWWFRFFDTWRPLIRPLLVAEGGDKAGGCGWMLVRMKKLCSFPLYCTFVTLTHIDLHYKEARWAICLPPRSLSPHLCVLWVGLWFLCSEGKKNTFCWQCNTSEKYWPIRALQLTLKYIIDPRWPLTLWATGGEKNLKYEGNKNILFSPMARK